MSEYSQWTEAKVFAYFESEDFKGLAEAINSAIAAERIAHNDTITAAQKAKEFYERAKQQYQQQLADAHSGLNDEMLKNHRHTEEIKRLKQTIEMWEKRQDETALAVDFAEWGWTIIANSSGGDWEKESKDWQVAAAKYRDDFHNTIRKLKRSERCPGPRQHGHPLIYESHCDHGETKAHDIVPPATDDTPNYLAVQKCGSHRQLEYESRPDASVAVTATDDAIQKLIKILKEKPRTWAMEEAIQLANEVAEELRQSRLAGQLVSRQLSDATVEIAMSKSGAK